MRGYNKIFLMGNLTKDPELKFTPDGTKYLTMRMASNRQYKDKTGELKEEALFINVIVWDKQAETCQNFLKKGSAIFVEGRLVIKQYESDGKKMQGAEIKAERVNFLDGKEKIETTEINPIETKIEEGGE